MASCKMLIPSHHAAPAAPTFQDPHHVHQVSGSKLVSAAAADGTPPASVYCPPLSVTSATTMNNDLPKFPYYSPPTVGSSSTATDGSASGGGGAGSQVYGSATSLYSPGGGGGSSAHFPPSSAPPMQTVAADPSSATFMVSRCFCFFLLLVDRELLDKRVLTRTAGVG